MRTTQQQDREFTELLGEEMRKKIPYIGFDNPTLEKLPVVKAGDTFVCPICGEEHELKACDDGSETILFYHCSDKIYLGAVSGRLVINIKPDISGKL